MERLGEPLAAFWRNWVVSLLWLLLSVLKNFYEGWRGTAEGSGHVEAQVGTFVQNASGELQLAVSFPLIPPPVRLPARVQGLNRDADITLQLSPDPLHGTEGAGQGLQSLPKSQRLSR